MAQSSQYTDFLSLSDKVFDELNSMSNTLVLAGKELNNNLFFDVSESSSLVQHMKCLEAERQAVFKLFTRLFSSASKAMTSIDNNVSLIKDQQEEIVNKVHSEIKTMVESNNENTDYFQQVIESQSSQIQHLEETVKELNETIHDLMELIKPPHITLEHMDMARYLIENTKNSQGKSIKGLDITIKNVAALLEQYDKVKKALKL